MNKAANRKKLNILKAARDVLALASCECKTIGNMNPAGMHCLVCSCFNLKEEIDKHVQWWEYDLRWQRASS